MDNKIIDYKVVHPEDVKPLLAEGWKPYGSPWLSEKGSKQALVKYYELTKEDIEKSSDALRKY